MLSCLWQAKGSMFGAVDGERFGPILAPAVALLHSFEELISPSHPSLLERVEASGSSAFADETKQSNAKSFIFLQFMLLKAGENLECHSSEEGPNPAWQVSAKASADGGKLMCSPCSEPQP